MTNNDPDFVHVARSWAAAGREHARILRTSDASLPHHKRTIGRYDAAMY